MSKYYNFNALVMHLNDKELLLFVYIIIDLRLANGIIYIDELASKFKLSDTTIRNYIIKICELNVLCQKNSFDNKQEKPSRCRKCIQFCYPTNTLLDYVKEYFDLLTNLAFIDSNHAKNNEVIKDAVDILNTSKNETFLLSNNIEPGFSRLQEGYI